MNAISLRQINLGLVFGILLITAVFIDSVDRSRQYLAILFAIWAIFHTYRLHLSQNWRLDFISLSPQAVKQLQYIVTLLIVMAGICVWWFSLQGYQMITAWITMFNIGLLFFKLVLTRA
jgi:hypothetical protein